MDNRQEKDKGASCTKSVYCQNCKHCIVYNVLEGSGLKIFDGIVCDLEATCPNYKPRY